jgi:hypothetical protein
MVVNIHFINKNVEYYVIMYLYAFLLFYKNFWFNIFLLTHKIFIKRLNNLINTFRFIYETIKII